MHNRMRHYPLPGPVEAGNIIRVEGAVGTVTDTQNNTYRYEYGVVWAIAAATGSLAVTVPSEPGTRVRVREYGVFGERPYEKQWIEGDG